MTRPENPHVVHHVQTHQRRWQPVVGRGDDGTLPQLVLQHRCRRRLRSKSLFLSAYVNYIVCILDIPLTVAFCAFNTYQAFAVTLSVHGCSLARGPL